MGNVALIFAIIKTGNDNAGVNEWGAFFGAEVITLYTEEVAVLRVKAFLFQRIKTKIFDDFGLGFCLRFVPWILQLEYGIWPWAVKPCFI